MWSNNIRKATVAFLCCIVKTLLYVSTKYVGWKIKCKFEDSGPPDTYWIMTAIIIDTGHAEDGMVNTVTVGGDWIGRLSSQNLNAVLILSISEDNKICVVQWQVDIGQKWSAWDS